MQRSKKSKFDLTKRGAKEPSKNIESILKEIEIGLKHLGAQKGPLKIRD